LLLIDMDLLLMIQIQWGVGIVNLSPGSVTTTTK
jgi:hypothetical protein